MSFAHINTVNYLHIDSACVLTKQEVMWREEKLTRNVCVEGRGGLIMVLTEIRKYQRGYVPSRVLSPLWAAVFFRLGNPVSTPLCGGSALFCSASVQFIGVDWFVTAARASFFSSNIQTSTFKMKDVIGYLKQQQSKSPTPEMASEWHSMEDLHNRKYECCVFSVWVWASWVI